MKRKSIILFIVVISFTFLSANIQSDFCAKNDVNIYFGNGMYNSFSDARLALAALERKMQNEFPEDLNVQYGLSYNYKEGHLDQLLEVARQNNFENYSEMLRWIAGIGFAPQWLQDWMTNTATAFDELEYVLDSDLQKHVQMYRTNILEGKPVVLVSHSQGNFYGNRASRLLQSSSFSVVGVATPSGYVAGNGNYTTLTNDLVISAVRSLDATTLPGNSTNGGSYEWTNHAFDKSYLRGDVSGPRIVRHLNSAVETAEYPGEEGQQGVLTVTLEWGSEPDVDLHMFEPNGDHVYYANMEGQSGYLDVDDVTSYGPEHYFVPCDKLEVGTYTVGVNYYDGSNSEVAKIQVKAGSQVMNFSKNLSESIGSAGNASPHIVAKINYSKNPDTGDFEFQIFSSTERGATIANNMKYPSRKGYKSDKVNRTTDQNY